MNRKKRVMCVYGTESGNSKARLQKLVKKWQKEGGANFEIVGDILSGNQLSKKLGGEGNASAKNLEFIAQSCDVLLVATSSHGAGDPPSTFREFFSVINHEASMKSDALTGVQHAVLGFGSSTYATFQNMPRLTDRYLGACGSRRLVRRCEVDEMDPLTGSEVDFKRWDEEVYAALQAPLPSASDAPVCDWTKPDGKVTELEGDDDDDDESMIPKVYLVSAVLISIVAYLIYFFFHREA